MKSDFGSSFTPWQQRERPRPKSLHVDQRSSSYEYIDLMQKKKLEEVRREFQLNGHDSPYNPDDDRIWARQLGGLSGLGTAAYLRQKSWPAPDSTPAPRLPRPLSLGDTNFATSTPIFDDLPPAPFLPDESASELAVREMVSAEQVRVLHSLPDAVLYNLLREMKNERKNKLPKECRFCRNNGERASFCQSHVLKDKAGRVVCPVLRAFMCRRCGAFGDDAHTIKYCPLATNEERTMSQGVMRTMSSIRKASGRRRYPLGAPPTSGFENYEPASSIINDSDFYPLEPVWAALEEKLSFQIDGAFNTNFKRHNFV